ncbi:MAG: glycine/betaine transporter [Thermomicrobiales bacterium]|jgi:osmoprotectant transport system permease protein|nr:glycine/betaine transporter [Thermomicrobiales bacterium]MDF2758965.1 glycine/betaine transporter [Thermomicrobiales bacterium]
MFADLTQMVAYIRDNQERFLELLSEHVQLTVVSVVVGLLIALPLAVVASRFELLAKPLTWLAAIGQTIPSIAILGLMLPFLGTGFVPSLFALTVRAILPIFLNGYVGIRSADPAIVDAARGMGTSEAQLLLMVQLPLASPVLFAGIQTATVQNIGLATLAAFIGGGGLGDLILQGLAMVDVPVLLAGAVPVALLAMVAEVGLSRMQRWVVPAGLQVGTR